MKGRCTFYCAQNRVENKKCVELHQCEIWKRMLGRLIVGGWIKDGYKWGEEKSDKRRTSEKNEDQRTILCSVYIKKIIAKNVVREEQGTVKIKRYRESAEQCQWKVRGEKYFGSGWRETSKEPLAEWVK